MFAIGSMLTPLLYFVVTVATIVLLLLWIFPWLVYDIKTIIPLIKLEYFVLHYCGRKRLLLVDLFEAQVKKNGSREFLKFENEIYTYTEANRKSIAISHTLLDSGLKRKDCVALLMHNEPSYIFCFLGMQKVGIEIAFLNYNLRQQPLLHCLKTSGASALIVGNDPDLQTAVLDIKNGLGTLPIYTLGKEINQNSVFKSLADNINQASTSEIKRSEHRQELTHSDKLGYIFTSGTTGLPKAAVITHKRSLVASALLSLADKVTEKDVIYTTLPLYHSAAGLIALGSTLKHGCTLVLRRKFSASAFWEDCHKYNVTVIQYIGELGRYLLATKEGKYDRDHNVRLAVGNGLRMDIWQKFVDRFGVKTIGEFYAATEGNTGFVNVCNRVGAIGRLSPLFQLLLPIRFIEYDFGTAEPIRGPDGYCKVVKPGEPGLFVAEISDKFSFEGYKGPKEMNDKKKLRNVFKTGDVYFNSGDVLVQDKDYFVYFSDRIGDTFRWKGENVSTIEVGNILTKVSWIEDANVYGIELPGYDGRCGMAAITVHSPDEPITHSQLEELHDIVTKQLPTYAQPMFVRVLKNAIITSTYKQQKMDLVKEGCNPEKMHGNQLLWLNKGKNCYEAFVQKLYSDVIEGRSRL